MSSKRETILNYVVDRLKGDPAIGAQNVTRSRTNPYKQEKLLSVKVNVEPVSEQFLVSPIGVLDSVLTIRLSALWSGEIPDIGAHETMEACHARLYSDLTLGGLAMDLTPRNMSWDFIDAEKSQVLVIYEFDVKYRH